MDEERQRYLDVMYQILDLPDEVRKNEMFKDTFISYAKFCYRHSLKVYDDDLFDKSQNLFILADEPIDYEIDNVKKLEAIERWKSALANINKGCNDGVSLDDAKLIITSVIQNARIELSKLDEYYVDFFKDSLAGECGYSQALTVFPLMELGVKVTVNNVSSLPDVLFGHAFATCTFPIKDEGAVFEKSFLLDATYRQFFLTIRCNEGSFYSGDERFKNKVGPDPGYYVCQSKDGILFAKELLKKGYVELTSENARMYGYGFSASGINLSTGLLDIRGIINHSGAEYIDVMNDLELQSKLDYSKEEFSSWKTNISLYNYIGTIMNTDDVKSNNFYDSTFKKYF